ncbi:MAG: RHS repeat-associated core domain-containing protein, partial [Ktedonobacterales bacterium]
MTCRAATSATTCAGSSPTGAALSYDNAGQLASWQNTPGSSPTQSASYLYDGAGQRVEQVATASGGGTTTTTVYLGAVEEVTSSGGTTTTTAYYGGLAESVNGTLSYLLNDGLGSATEAVAANGGVSAVHLYGPYGGVRYQQGTLPTDHGYTGQISDAATSGLDYYGARYYDAVAGQFTSADTWLAGGLNRYAYVGDNPEVFVDPSGHHAQGCDIGLCGGEDDGWFGGVTSNQGGNTDDSHGIGGGGGDDNPQTGSTTPTAPTATYTYPVLNGETFSVDSVGDGTVAGEETQEWAHGLEQQQAERDTNATNPGNDGDQQQSG